MIVFLVDADNLCAAPWLEEAFKTLEEIEGTVSVRRAYGSAEKLKGLNEVLRVRAVRLFVNVPLSKNTTDVALAIDAMELSYQIPKPTTFVIGSGDADFVPLALRLRERGFRMVCVSERTKMSQEAVSAYDRVVLVGEVRSIKVHADAVFAEVTSEPSRKLAEPRPRGAEAPKAVKKVVAVKVAVKKSAPAKPAKKLERKENPIIEISKILEVIPALKDGGLVSLRDAAKLLHDAKLIGKSAPSTKLFKKYPTYFELSPKKSPNQVQFLRKVRP